MNPNIPLPLLERPPKKMYPMVPVILGNPYIFPQQQIGDLGFIAATTEEVEYLIIGY